MPFKLFQKMNMGTLTPKHSRLQFADRSTQSTRSMIEDVMVQVGSLTFLADFTVLDMEEDSKVSIILGRPFLATSQGLMDMRDHQLILKARGKELVINSSSIKEEQPIVDYV